METLRRCIHRQPPPSVGVVAYSRHRDPEEEEEEEEEEGEGGDGGAGPLVLLPPPPPRPRPRLKPRPQPRPCLHPLVTLALGSASAFLLGLLVAGIGRTPCGGGAWAGPDPGDVTLEEVVGGARPEAPPTWPQLREELQRRLRGERIEAWVREVAMEPHPPGSGRGQALAQAVLSAMVGAGLHRAWNRPQRVPLPTRGPPPSLVWVDAEGRELERLHLDPDAFCPWSPAGNVTGGLVYGHYGRPQDLELLRARGVTLGGHILLLRMGKGTPAAKVAAAEAVGAVGVLLYHDPQDVAGPGGTPGLGGDTAASVHVQDGAGDPYSRGFPSFTARAPPNRPPDLPHIPVHYPELLHTKAAAYISLDHAVLGDDRVVVHSSPLLHSVIESALRQVSAPPNMAALLPPPTWRHCCPPPTWRHCCPPPNMAALLPPPHHVAPPIKGGQPQ
ncbi:transferrin receptor protein 2 [Coturnix japonica]|uniref:transferrin receptor protein 2 n=1 Tax=Coturnix japonica TaxID=93934 RepID=UPI0013A5BE38|nr:transferrin receptor protein 2 [Coturnix japonica]